MEIQPGMRVEVTTAAGNRVEMITLSGRVQGVDMPVVWVAEVDDYQANHDEAYRLPWPAQYVHQTR